MRGNQSGFITVDFMFSIVLILGFSSLLFVVTFTLSVASVTQYITYAAAHNYSTAHIDISAQQARADMKYKELVGNSVLKPLFTNGWYLVDESPSVGDQTKFVEAFREGAGNVNEMWGAGTGFTATILDFHIPFFGATNPEGDGKGTNFKTYLSSSLGREPTEVECIQFTAARWEAIRNLSVPSGATYSTGTSSNGYFPMTDDGC